MNNEEIATLLAKSGKSIRTQEDIANMLEEKGNVEVEVHIGRREISCPLQLSLVNQEAIPEEQREEMFKGFSGITTKAIPIEMSRKIKSIDSKLRQAANKYSIRGTKIMSKDNLEEFLKFYEKVKEEFLGVKAEILDNYDQVVAEYISKNEAIFDAIVPDKKDSLMKEVYASLISKDTLDKGMYLSLEFGQNTNVAIFEGDIKKKVEEIMSDNVNNKIIDIVSGLLSSQFSALNNFYKVVKSRFELGRNLPESTQLTLHKAAIQTKDANIFGNENIYQFSEQMEELSKGTNIPMVLGDAEETLASIYGYAKELELDGLLDMDKSVLSRSLLEEILEDLM